MEPFKAWYVPFLEKDTPEYAEIVRPLFERRLAELGRTDIEFGIIEQDHPLGTFELEPELPALKAGC